MGGREREEGMRMRGKDGQTWQDKKSTELTLKDNWG